MIELTIEDYCQDCPEFEPIKESMELISLGDSRRRFITQVMCKHRDKCSAISEKFKESASQ